MIQFSHQGSAPTLLDIAKRFAISEDLIDTDFGVIQTDPEAGLYVILVDQRVSKKIFQQLGQEHEELESRTIEFSNPSIEPFGPPKE